MSEKIIKTKMTWQGVAPIIIAGFTNGNNRAKTISTENVEQMARICDEHIELTGQLEKMIQDNIINFIFFTANFSYNFIEQAWSDTDKSHLIPHLKEKLSAQSNGNFIDSGGFLKFFFELDDENRRILINWIKDNYKAFTHFTL